MMKPGFVFLLAGAVACTSAFAQVPAARDTSATGGFANGSGNQDSSHPTVVMSSPSFQLLEDMAVNFIIAGGQGSAATVATDLASVPANSSNAGFHNNNTNTDATLLFDLTTPATVGPTGAIFVDLYGRSNCCQGRDDDIDIAFLDASDTVLGELTGQTIPNAAPYHLRVSSAAAGVSGTVAKIRITGHDSEGDPNVSNSFTLMEMRAATVTPGYTNTNTVVEVNGVPANVGSQITLPSGTLLTVSSNGKFTYDPNGVFDVTAPAEGADSFTYGMGYGTATFSAGALTASGPGTVALSGSSSLTVDSGTLDLAVTGTGSVVKNTTGQLTVLSDSTFDGGMVINGGRVQSESSGALGAGPVTVNDSGQVFIVQNLTADLTIQGDGWTEGAGQLGAIRFANGTTLTGDVTVDAAGARIVAYNGAVGNIDGDLLGGGNLEINFVSNETADGTVNLLGSGATGTSLVTVSRGRLNMGSALGGSVLVEDTGTLGDEGVITGSLQLGSTGGGGATLVIDAGTLEMSGTNEGSVFTADTSDAWQIGGPDNNWSSSDGLFFNGDTVTFNDTVNGLFSGTVTTSGAVNPASVTFDNDTQEYTLEGSITGTGSLTKDGPGTVNLNSRHSFTGGTVVNDGVLNLAGGGGPNGTIRGTATVNSGAILRGSVQDVTGYNDSPASLQTINLAGGEFNIATTLNQTLGSATLNLSGGSITGIAGSNLEFFQGGSTINTLASADSSVISGTRVSLRQVGGLTLTVADGAAVDDLVVDSVIRHSGRFTDDDVTKAGAGKMVLNATNVYQSKTIINEGILSLGTNTAIHDGNTVDINGSGVLDLAFSSGAEAIGVLNIDGNPVADGIYGATGSGADILDDVHFSGPGRLLVGAYPYDTWEAFYGIVGAGNGTNSDTDSADNLLEFGFGTDPTVNDDGPLAYDGSTVTRGAPDIQVDFPGGGGVDFTARFLRRKDHGIPGSVSYAVQFSADLDTWEDSTEEPSVVADDGDYELVEIPYPLFIGGNQKARFFRVVVTAL